MINLRFHQLSEHVYPVELEEPVIAESRGGRVEDRIRSHANIIIELSQPDLAVTINADMPLIRRMLENGMSIATSDPVARFSKPSGWAPRRQIIYRKGLGPLHHPVDHTFQASGEESH